MTQTDNNQWTAKASSVLQAAHQLAHDNAHEYAEANDCMSSCGCLNGCGPMGASSVYEELASSLLHGFNVKHRFPTTAIKSA